MLAAPHRGRRCSTRTLFALFIAFLITSFWLLDVHSQPPNLPVHLPTSLDDSYPAYPSPELKVFWSDLLNELVGAKPLAGPVQVIGRPRDEDMDPNKPYTDGSQPTDIIRINDSDREGLQNAHERFAAAVGHLAPRMPYKKRSRGIVMTAGGRYIGMAITSLLMLRRTGSNLPVELFLDSAEDYNHHLCDERLPKLNARCLIMDDVFSSTPDMPKLEKFQFKVFSIIFSEFSDILFLDADAFPIHSPDYLFDNNPYKSYGLVTWPDLWMPTVSPVFYDLANLTAPPLKSRRSSESGIMMYDKSRHAESIILASYYNFYGPHYYYPLFSQGAHGEGDKETFLHSAAVLGKPFYDVKTPMGFLGRWIKGDFRTAGMKQADPVEDYNLQLLKRNKGQANKEEKDGKNEKRARWLFLHHNIVKLDLRKMDDPVDTVSELNENGKLMRMWGDDNKLIEMSGYDVEKVMWEEIIKANCETSYFEQCERLREFYTSVFTPPPSE